MAAPSKFTEETVKALLTGIRAGLPYHLAAEAAGISYQTFNEWQQGRFPRGADKQLKAEFSDQLTRARGQSARRLAAVITSAANDDWRAAAWMLERRFPKDYGRDAEALQRLEAIQALLEQWRAAGSPPIRLRDVS